MCSPSVYAVDGAKGSDLGPTAALTLRRVFQRSRECPGTHSLGLLVHSEFGVSTSIPLGSRLHSLRRTWGVGVQLGLRRQTLTLPRPLGVSLSWSTFRASLLGGAAGGLRHVDLTGGGSSGDGHALKLVLTDGSDVPRATALPRL